MYFKPKDLNDEWNKTRRIYIKMILRFGGRLNLTISVIIPAWNAEASIKDCLESITNQSKQPYEIIFVDDGSTDNTTTIAREFNITLLSTGGRKGPAIARNMGASASKGQVILFLDSDVIVPGDLIEKMASHFADESIWAVQTLYTPICPASDLVSQYQNYYYYYSFSRMPETGNATFATWCSAVRRDKFIEIGGFNVRIPEPTVEDEELGYTIVDNGGIIILDKSILVNHLAAYNLAQFTTRRLRMARAQAKSGWRQIRRRLFGRYINVHESGTHHSRWVVLSILLVLSAQLCILCSLLSLSIVPLITAMLLLCAALLCHTNFLRKCNKDLKRNVRFAFSLLCLYDMAVLSWGIVQGSIQYAFGKKY